MTLSSFPPDQVKAQVRSTRGETIDLAIPIDCTVGDLRGFIINEYHYGPNTLLMFNGAPANDATYVNDYPYGSLILAYPPEMQSGGWQQGGQLYPSQQPQRYPDDHSHAARHQRRQQHPNQPPAQPSSFADHNSHPNRNHRNRGRRSNRQQAAQPEAATPAPVSAAAVEHLQPVETSPPAPGSRGGRGGHGRGRGRGRGGARATQHRTPSAEVVGSDNGTNNTTAAPATKATDHAGVQDVRRQQGGTPNSSSHAGSERRSQSATPSRGTPRPAPPSATTPPDAQANANKTATEASANTPSPCPVQQFAVECIIPDLQKHVTVQMSADASVADLVLAVIAADPEVAGDVKVVYRGKVLPKLPESKLFNFGIRGNCSVFICSGEFSNPENVILLEIEEDVKRVEKNMSAPLTDLQRKGYYEELMRILFRTDGLQEVEGKWKQMRKDMVKQITHLQDQLHVSVD